MKLMPCITLALIVCLVACNRHPRDAEPTAGSRASPDAAATTAPCGARPPPAPATATAATATAELAGHWSGDATVIVQWAKQRDLIVVLDIARDGRVSGTVGDAKLVDARFISNPLGRKLRIHGKLEGNLIDAEQVRRDAVDVLVDRADDGTLVGGLHSSGTKMGGKETMKLSASGMVLRRRREPVAADDGDGD